MGKPPAYQWYPKDAMSDLVYAAMTLEQVGAYRTLLDHAWLDDGLPDNESVLKGLCKNPPNWDEIWAVVGQRFTPDEHGRLRNHRLEEERAKGVEWRKKSSQGGKKSAAVRAAKRTPAPKPPKQEELPGTPKRTLTTITDMQSLYNELCPSLPTIKGIAGARLKAVNARREAHPARAFWRDYFTQVEASDFLTGRTEDPFTHCNFDWLLKEANMHKVLEGNYKNGVAEEAPEFTGAGEPGGGSGY